ncbi:MAG: ribonucleotide-diphosphate reductase subunit beta, partial [Desulfobacterales bacterium]|nr:ribonucleotide-diphosphate reductase subunit beta [Desulfobacterales bacterium]
DILNYLRQRASQAGTDLYETELNNILREFIEIEKNASSSVLPLQLETLLADRRFIEAVARQVKAHNSETGR